LVIKFFDQTATPASGAMMQAITMSKVATTERHR
jgi:hypothetical protein